MPTTIQLNYLLPSDPNVGLKDEFENDNQRAKDNAILLANIFILCFQLLVRSFYSLLFIITSMLVLGQLSAQLMPCCPAHIVLFHECICAEMLEQI